MFCSSQIISWAEEKEIWNFFPCLFIFLIRVRKSTSTSRVKTISVYTMHLHTVLGSTGLCPRHWTSTKLSNSWHSEYLATSCSSKFKMQHQVCSSDKKTVLNNPSQKHICGLQECCHFVPFLKTFLKISELIFGGLFKHSYC